MGEVMALEKYWETPEFTTYVDADQAKRTGNTVLIWIINDYHVPKKNAIGQSFKSDRVLFEVQCLKKSRKVLELYLYSLPMGKGEVIYSDKNVKDPVGPVPSPGKVGHRTWEIACGVYKN